MRPPAPRWIEPAPDDGRAAADLSAALGLPESLCRLLVARGYPEPVRAKGFLRPLIGHFHSPRLLADAERAAERITRAIRDGEGMLVHGDYDVDGVSGAALLTRFLRDLGGQVEAFVPHRVRDGYDLGDSGIEAALAASARLLITVDCGISAHAAVERAKDAGLDVIVTDHHVPPGRLPDALAVVNPNRPDCGYPNKALSGTGVAFKMCALLAEGFGLSIEDLLPRLDLVALATVADLVQLEGENRALVRFGVRAFQRTRHPGLLALIESAGVEVDRIDASTLGWVLGPRINAVGRVADAGTALRLMISDDEDECRELAGELERANLKRRELDQRVLDEAVQLLPTHFDPASDHSAVLASPGWHPGVIGIVASRLVERIHRPVVMISLDGDSGRGSARSIPGFDLHAAFEACSADLVRFGGHAGAAGMDIPLDRIASFRAAFEGIARTELAGHDLRPELGIDVDLDLEEASLDFLGLLQHLGPFGKGNRSPVFRSRGLELSGPAREVGRGHLKLAFRKRVGVLDAIGFGLARRWDPASVTVGRWDVVYHLEENRYRGRSSVQARVLDIAPAGDGG